MYNTAWSPIASRRFKIKQILESEGNKEAEDDKFNRVDMLVENRKGELVIVEHIAEGQPVDGRERITKSQ